MDGRWSGIRDTWWSGDIHSKWHKTKVSNRSVDFERLRESILWNRTNRRIQKTSHIHNNTLKTWCEDISKGIKYNKLRMK